MLYVQNWGFHIKSYHQSETLESVLLLVNQWRMPLIWMISGIATHYLLNKLSFTAFLSSRTIRLLLPLTAGILFVVPPQLYFEMKFNGDMNLSLWQFWQVFFDVSHPMFEGYQAGIWPHMDVNHLWYLRELWVFTLILLALHPFLKSSSISNLVEKSGSIAGRYSVLLFPITLLFVLDRLALVNLTGDAVRQAEGFVFFLFGYLITHQNRIWQQLRKLRQVSLALAMLSYCFLVYRYQNFHLIDDVEVSSNLKLLFSLTAAANQWLWLAAIFGYGLTYLNRENRWITYLTPAVYPFYIFHQTIIIGIGYPLIQMKLWAPLEAGIILILTFVISWVGYQMVCKVKLLKPFFGLTLSSKDLPKFNPMCFQPALYRTLGILLVLPVAIPVFVWFFSI